MKQYRRLSEKDAKKIRLISWLKRSIKSTAKWSFTIASIFICLILGIFLFYNVIDNREVDNSTDYSEISKTISSETENDLTESEKHELEIDSEKEEDNTSQEDKEEIIKKEMDSNYDFSKWNEVCPKELIITNKFNPISDKYKVNTKLCRGKEIDADVCDHLEQMIVDARKDDIILWISSGYRSVELQSKLFYNQVAREKNKSVITDEEAEKRAQTVVALPRTSEHNTGLAVDFNGVQDDFYTKKEYKWLMDNAHRYGFIERYQKKWQDKTGVIYEPWHFMYVGVENSLLIKESGLSLEEYVFQNLMKNM